jgi:hypothetical protein
MFIREWGSEWMKNYYPETGELTEDTDYVGDEIQKRGYRVVSRDQYNRKLTFATDQKAIIKVTVPELLIDGTAIRPMCCFLKDNKTVRVFTAMHPSVGSDMVEYDLGGNIEGIYIQPSRKYINYENVFINKYHKFGEPLGEEVGNNGESYMEYSLTDGILINRNELQIVTKNTDAKK